MMKDTDKHEGAQGYPKCGACGEPFTPNCDDDCASWREGHSYRIDDPQITKLKNALQPAVDKVLEWHGDDADKVLAQNLDEDAPLDEMTRYRSSVKWLCGLGQVLYEGLQSQDEQWGELIGYLDDEGFPPGGGKDVVRAVKRMAEFWEGLVETEKGYADEWSAAYNAAVLEKEKAEAERDEARDRLAQARKELENCNQE